MKKFLIILSIFSCGDLFNDICRELGFTLFTKAYAYGSLDEEDVREIIENCNIRGGSVYGSVSGRSKDVYF